jgi:hypothetical protein
VKVDETVAPPVTVSEEVVVILETKTVEKTPRVPPPPPGVYGNPLIEETVKDDMTAELPIILATFKF